MILDTDYKTYAAVFSCDDLWFNVERYINAWVITRERNYEYAREAVSTENTIIETIYTMALASNYLIAYRK